MFKGDNPHRDKKNCVPRYNYQLNMHHLFTSTTVTNCQTLDKGMLLSSSYVIMLNEISEAGLHFLLTNVAIL